MSVSNENALKEIKILLNDLYKTHLEVEMENLMFLEVLKTPLISQKTFLQQFLKCYEEMRDISVTDKKVKYFITNKINKITKVFTNPIPLLNVIESFSMETVNEYWVTMMKMFLLLEHGKNEIITNTLIKRISDIENEKATLLAQQQMMKEETHKGISESRQKLREKLREHVPDNIGKLTAQLTSDPSYKTKLREMMGDDLFNSIDDNPLFKSLMGKVNDLSNTNLHIDQLDSLLGNNLTGNLDSNTTTILQKILTMDMSNDLSFNSFESTLNTVKLLIRQVISVNPHHNKLVLKLYNDIIKVIEENMNVTLLTNLSVQYGRLLSNKSLNGLHFLDAILDIYQDKNKLETIQKMVSENEQLKNMNGTDFIPIIKGLIPVSYLEQYNINLDDILNFTSLEELISKLTKVFLPFLNNFSFNKKTEKELTPEELNELELFYDKLFIESNNNVTK